MCVGGRVGGVTQTLAVFGGLTMALLLAALVVAWSGRGLLGTWTLVVAFVSATLWSGLNYAWARSNPSALPSRSWLLLTTVAATAVVYYFYLAMDGRELGGGS